MHGVVHGCRYWAARCRRLVKSADNLARDLGTLLDKYAGEDGLDLETGLQLLTPATKDVHDRVLDLIRQGRVSGKRLLRGKLGGS